jgi:hypothetical protein
MEIQEMKREQLINVAKELGIKGVSQLKKAKLIEVIEATQTVEEVEITVEATQEVESSNETTEVQSQQLCEELHYEEVQVEKPIKPSKKVKRPIYLMNPKGEIVQEFESTKLAIDHCVTEKYANIGWCSCSLNTGLAFYQKENGKLTKPTSKSGYHGVGYRLVYKI